MYFVGFFTHLQLKCTAFLVILFWDVICEHVTDMILADVFFTHADVVSNFAQRELRGILDVP